MAQLYLICGINEKPAPAPDALQEFRGKYRYIIEMFSKEFLEILTHILKSWQVIAVSIALIIYLYLVSFVSRSYHRPIVKKVKKVKKSKKSKEAEPELSEEPAETGGSGDSNDELGLEEA